MDSPKKVLVVDDDVVFLETLVDLLEEDGICVTTAAGASQALKILRTAEFDAILTDIRMPGKDGIRLARQLRAVRPVMPIILMTAFGTASVLEDAMVAGAFDYLMKPFSRKSLRASLAWAFSS